MKRRLGLTAGVVLTAVLAGGFWVAAHAVDGVTLITQALVMNSGGFPYTITQPGSYRLASNLAVSSTDGIVIAADNVMLDLNGFSIAGAPLGIRGVTDNGVSHTAIAVRNGTITSFFGSGIALGSSSQNYVEQIRAHGNQVGILVGANSTVRNNITSANGPGPFGGGAGIIAVCPTNLIGNMSHNNLPADTDIVTVGSGCTRYNNNPAP